MKKSIKYIVVIFFLGLLISCGQSDKSSDFLDPVDIEIPAGLKENDEVVDFIKQAEKDINTLSVKLEELAQDTQEYIYKDEEDLSTLDKIRLVAALGKFSSAMLEYTAKHHEIEKEIQSFERGLDTDKAVAMETIMKVFDQRMNEINVKYSDLNTKNESE